MANLPAKIEPITLPDLRRPTQMPSLPAWAASRVAALVLNVQINPETKKFADAMTLPANMLPTVEQRTAIMSHTSSLHSYLRQTPEADQKSEAKTLVAITKLLLALPGQKNTETGAEAKGEAYMAALDDVPWWATEAAIRKWYRGECGSSENSEAYNYNWAPAPATLRRIACQQTVDYHRRIGLANHLLGAVEFVDCAAEIAQGRAAMRGLFKTVRDKGNLSELTFDKAIDLGTEKAAE